GLWVVGDEISGDGDEAAKVTSKRIIVDVRDEDIGPLSVHSNEDVDVQVDVKISVAAEDAFVNDGSHSEKTLNPDQSSDDGGELTLRFTHDTAASATATACYHVHALTYHEMMLSCHTVAIGRTYIKQLLCAHTNTSTPVGTLRHTPAYATNPTGTDTEPNDHHTAADASTGDMPRTLRESGGGQVGTGGEADAYAYTERDRKEGLESHAETIEDTAPPGDTGDWTGANANRGGAHGIHTATHARARAEIGTGTEPDRGSRENAVADCNTNLGEVETERTGKEKGGMREDRAMTDNPTVHGEGSTGNRPQVNVNSWLKKWQKKHAGAEEASDLDGLSIGVRERAETDGTDTEIDGSNAETGDKNFDANSETVGSNSETGGTHSETRGTNFKSSGAELGMFGADTQTVRMDSMEGQVKDHEEVGRAQVTVDLAVGAIRQTTDSRMGGDGSRSDTATTTADEMHEHTHTQGRTHSHTQGHTEAQTEVYGGGGVHAQPTDTLPKGLGRSTVAGKSEVSEGDGIEYRGADETLKTGGMLEDVGANVGAKVREDVLENEDDAEYTREVQVDAQQEMGTAGSSNDQTAHNEKSRD
ncbi:hypothetical protein, variant, partial [Sphaeroforma arctica JP610]